MGGVVHGPWLIVHGGGGGVVHGPWSMVHGERQSEEGIGVDGGILCDLIFAPVRSDFKVFKYSKVARKSKLITIVLSVIVFGACEEQPGNINLSGGYWYQTIDCSDCRMISSRVRLYYNSIYPTVTDCAFNENFILAEQRPAKENYIAFFGEDLFRRFQYYSIYKKTMIC